MVHVGSLNITKWSLKRQKQVRAASESSSNWVLRVIERFKSFGAQDFGTLGIRKSEIPFGSLGVAMDGEWGKVMVGVGMDLA